MRLRHPLLALSLLVVLAPAAAFASVRASGLSCAAVGAATLSPSSDGRRLPVHNLGSSGEDGVDVSLSRLDGHRISSSSSWGDADEGMVCSFSWGMSSSSSGTSSTGRVMVHKLHNGQRFSCDLSEFSSSSSMTCLLYRDGALVSSFTCPSSSVFDVSTPPGTVSRVPECTLELDHASSRVLSSVSFSTLVTYFQNGSIPVQCDRMVCVGDLDRDGALDVCAVRCAVPATSSLHDLDFDSQSCVRFGVSLSTASLDLSGTDDELSMVDNPLFQSSSFEGQSPLHERVYGHGGGGGGGAGGLALSSLDASSSPFSLQFSRRSPFVFDPATDAGASLECRVVGTGTCSPTGEVASLRSLYLPSHVLEVSSSFAGMCADQESVFVSLGGDLVASFVMPSSHSVSVQAPPGGPLGMAINEKGLPGEKKPVKKSSTKGPAQLGTDGAGTASSVVGSDGLSLHVAFADPRVVCVDGTCVTGDDITFSGQCSSGTCGSSVITITGTNFGMERCSSGSCSSGSSSFAVTGMPSSGVDQVHASVAPTASLSSTSPVVTVPVLIDRVDTTPARGASVTFHLSSNLVLAAPVTEYDYFSRFGSSQMFVVDNGGGSFTVDCALLGGGCGPSSDGALFALSVARAPGAPDGLGFVSVDAVDVADCSAGTIPSSAGGRVYVVLDGTAPSPPTIVATQVKTGNDASGTTRVNLQLGSLAVEDYVEVYRAPFGNYPLYEDGPSSGSVPAVPTSYPPGAPWEPVSLSCSANPTGGEDCDDHDSRRGYDYYMAVSHDRAGNVSSYSSMTSGTLDYHLGDVAGGGAACVGDNQVTTADISALGAHYGAQLAVGSPFACLDVGPTADGTIDGRPSPDQRLSFKDLILYAINFSLVSMPAQRPDAAAVNTLRVAATTVPAVGQTFDVALEMEGAGDVQGLSAQLAWDPAVVEPVAVREGGLLSQQGREGVVLSASPGGVDAALLGVGGGIAGSGTLATVTFRVRAEGEPAIRIGSVDARDAFNRSLGLSTDAGAGAIPGRTALRMAFPNPFSQDMTIALALSKSGPASVGVFDVAGRKVRTLVHGVQPAGERLLTWDGRDDSGARLGAGVYMLRLDAGGHSETRAVRLVK